MRQPMSGLWHRFAPCLVPHDVSAERDGSDTCAMAKALGSIRG